MTDMLLTNLAIYSAQVTCLVLIGAAVATLFRVDVASVRYAQWRGLLALCLLLPLLQGWQEVPAVVRTAQVQGTVADEPGVPLATRAASTNSPLPWSSVLIVIAGTGFALRLVWLGISLARLRRLRMVGRLPDQPDTLEHIQGLVRTRAEIRYVSGLSQPVTFGVHRPVVLLPETLLQQRAAVQDAVLCHELLHVRRGDWLWLVAEEALRALTWFNPAMWWLISRVQLAREEVVDEMTVLTTGRRRAYLEALVAFADARPLGPAATAFARSRTLYLRLVCVSKEAVMSSWQVVASCAAAAAILTGATWGAVHAWPLQQTSGGRPGEVHGAEGPRQIPVRPITPENPIPRRVHVVPVEYPPALIGSGYRAALELRVIVGASGSVINVGGSALALASRSSDPVERNLQRGAMERLAAGTMFQESAMKAIREWRYDPPFEGPVEFFVRVVFTPDAPATTSQSHSARGVTAAQLNPRITTQDANGKTAVRVGGVIRQPTKTKHVRPMYPPQAREAGVQGVVIIEATIGADGRVTDTQVIRSIPQLDAAAVAAVRQWEFTPTTLNGAPLPVLMTTTVQFTLSQ